MTVAPCKYYEPKKMLIGTTTGCLFGYRTGKRVKATAWKNDWKNSINRGKHANNPAKPQQTNKYFKKMGSK